MKPFTLVLFSLGLSSLLYAQPTQRITRESGDKYSRQKEVYFALKSDTSVRQGLYKFFYKSKLINQGYYKNGVKDSVWETYSGDGTVLSKRQYAAGKRTGVWEFHGRTEMTIDFTSGKPVYDRSSDDTTTFFYANPDGSWTRGNLDVKPIQLVSSSEWLNYLMRTLRYPDEAVNKEIMGTVVVSVTLDETGKAVDYGVLSSPAPELSAEALRVVTSLDCEYLPAEKDGKKVKSLYLVPIVFKLENG